MHYRGWKRDQPDGDAIYRTYVDKISTLIGRLLEDGQRVHLFVGDKADETALLEVAGALVGVGALALGGRGGGRDDLAQGGGSDAAASPAALAAIGTALAG